MTATGRRLPPLAVFAAGVLAAAMVVAVSARARRSEHDAMDRQVAALVAAEVGARVDSLSRSVRAAASAFDLSALAPREVSGVLRLAYAQAGDVTAVTLLDRDGSAVVPAAFLSRVGGLDASRAAESLDDLDLFSRRLPFSSAMAHGHALVGPYAAVHSEGARFAAAYALAVADGTRTWVIAAELDASHALDALPPVPEADVLWVTDGVELGRRTAATERARSAIRAAVRTGVGHRALATLGGTDWRAVLVPAPTGLDGDVVVLWSGEGQGAARVKQNDLALGVIVLSVFGALVAALLVAQWTQGAAHNPEPRATVGRDARVLGAVVKELANPIAAVTAAAQLLAHEANRSRVAETVQRSALRVARAFGRVARLARSGEETSHADVDLAAVVARELAALPEPEANIVSHVAATRAVRVRANDDDVALLLHALLDAARAVSPAGAAIELWVDAESRQVRVRDAGTLTARDRRALLTLDEGGRTMTAAPVLAWALADRIATDHRARFELSDVPTGGVEACVQFEPSPP